MSSTPDTIFSLAVCRVGAEPVLVAGREDGSIERLKLPSLEAFGEPMKGHAEWVRAMDVDGARLVSGSAEDVRVWDVARGLQLGDPIAVKARLVALAPVQGQPAVVTISQSNWTDVWHADTHERIAGPLSDWSAAAGLARRGDGLLAILEDERDGELLTLQLWDILEGTKVSPILAGGDPGGTVMRAPLRTIELEGKILLLAGNGADGKLRVWDTIGVERLHVLAHPDEITCVDAVPRNGEFIMLTGCRDEVVRLWSHAGTVRELGAVSRGDERHKVNAVALADTGDRLVAIAASSGGGLCCWDAITGAVLAKR